MDSRLVCQSCAMPIEDGLYCQHCTDDSGNLQEFSVRLQQMSQWMLSQGHADSTEDAAKKAREYMANMPAWKNHPELS